MELMCIQVPQNMGSERTDQASMFYVCWNTSLIVCLEGHWRLARIQEPR